MSSVVVLVLGWVVDVGSINVMLSIGVKCVVGFGWFSGSLGLGIWCGVLCMGMWMVEKM